MKTNKYETILIIISIIVVIAIFSFIALSINNSTSSVRSNEYLNSNTNNEVKASENKNKNDNYSNDIKEVKTETVTEEKLLSTFSTNIYDNDTNRVQNIALAISKINEKILDVDEIFSFNQTVGPMDLDHGFKESTVFDSDGNVIKAPGGGMCQISSTMYCACLEGNLEIIERHPHSRRVDYVPVDRDATIYYDTLDYKFKNNSGSKLKILATSDEYNVTITINKIEEKTVVVDEGEKINNNNEMSKD